MKIIIYLGAFDNSLTFALIRFGGSATNTFCLGPWRPDLTKFNKTRLEQEHLQTYQYIAAHLI